MPKRRVLRQICAACRARSEPGQPFLKVAVEHAATKIMTTVCSQACADDLAELLVPGGLAKARAADAATAAAKPAAP